MESSEYSSLINEDEKLVPYISELDIEDISDEELYRIDPDSDDNKKEILKYDVDESGDDFIPPDKVLSANILQQVEHLFSDTNLIKDKFLLKHIRRNKDGFVSLKLISSLRKIRSLSKDWRVVAYSLRHSKQLEMNEEKTKIRRFDPLPEIETFSDSNKVLVLNIPSDVKTNQDVKLLFKNLGQVNNAWILSSSKTASPGIRRRLASTKTMYSATYAIAEFKTAEDAFKATKHIPTCSNPFLVVPLSNDDKNCKSKKEHSPMLSPKKQQNLKSAEDYWKKILKIDDNKQNDETCHLSYYKSVNAEHSNERKFHSFAKKATQFNSENEQYYKQLLPNMHRGDGPVMSSWIQRRQMCINLGRKNVIIMREPKGPDGTNGFHERRARVNLQNRTRNILQEVEG